MAKAPQPLRAVVSSTVGPRCQHIVLPNGDQAIVCGDPPRTDTLECGHQVTTWGGRAARRRCPECPPEPSAAVKKPAPSPQGRLL